MIIQTGLINRISPNNLFLVTIKNNSSTITDNIIIYVYDRDFTPPKVAYRVTVFIPPLRTTQIQIPIYCLRYADSTIINQLQLAFNITNFISSISYGQLYYTKACDNYFTLI